MNFDVCPLNNRIAPANSPHQSPRTHGEANLLNAGGGSSRAPSRYSQTSLNNSSSLINHPINNRRKKNIAVFRSMQKNAHPRFTITNVSAQLSMRPTRGPVWCPPFRVSGCNWDSECPAHPEGWTPNGSASVDL